MTVIAHISDLHVSKLDFDEDTFLKVVDDINDLNPDMIILTGDITDKGYYADFLRATEYLQMFKSPLFAVPGNHDSRNRGYETFEELIGERSWKVTKKDELMVIGLDSSAPDLNTGHIGREQQIWMEHELEKANQNSQLSIVAMHHHVIPIPRTGRERNMLTDSGDILQSLISKNVNIVMCGHKHVPNIWKMEDTLFVNAGSVSSFKLRGKDINSYNTYDITDDYIEIYLNKMDDTKELFGRFDRK